MEDSVVVQLGIATGPVIFETRQEFRAALRCLFEDKLLGALQHLDHGIRAPDDATNLEACDEPSLRRDQTSCQGRRLLKKLCLAMGIQRLV